MATIALVDDDKNILTSVSMLLEQEGYHVKSFSDPAAALTALSSAPPDLAILEVCDQFLILLYAHISGPYYPRAVNAGRVIHPLLENLVISGVCGGS